MKGSSESEALVDFLLKATRSFCSLGLSTRKSRRLQLCVAVGWSTETQNGLVRCKGKGKGKELVCWFGADTAEAKADDKPLPYVSINGWDNGSSRVANKIERQEGSELQQQRRLVKGC